jgi:putative oxidoreductase
MSIETTVSPSRAERLEAIVMFSGRALVALLFMLAGAAKMFNGKPFLAHMTEFGVPTFLLPAVIVLELGAGVAILVGWRVREAAGSLAVFCMMTAAVFHHQLWINTERTLFFKDLAIAGGLLAIAAGAAARLRQNVQEK